MPENQPLVNCRGLSHQTGNICPMLVLCWPPLTHRYSNNVGIFMRWPTESWNWGRLRSPGGAWTRIAVLMVTHRLRGWTNIETALREFPVLTAGMVSLGKDRPCPAITRRYFKPIWFQCWTSVCDAGPTLKPHWLNVSCKLGVDSLIWSAWEGRSLWTLWRTVNPVDRGRGWHWLQFVAGRERLLLNPGPHCLRPATVSRAL